jgi:hypothetical protein
LIHTLRVRAGNGRHYVFRHIESPARNARPRKYAHRRTDFIEALRQIRASNNLQSLRQVVDALNLGRTDAVPALHDTVHGSVPGLSVAVYNPVKPELLHAAAAKMALAANQPGAAVFHVRPGGSDHLWRFRQALQAGFERRADRTESLLREIFQKPKGGVGAAAMNKGNDSPDTDGGGT